MREYPFSVTANCALRSENQYFTLLKEGHLNFASKGKAVSNQNGQTKKQENLNTVKTSVNAV